MKTTQKDKRTKDQLLQLLDDALVQEEQRSDEIAALKAELVALRKNLEDPRAELVEEAIPSSKTPFRLDFYRTTDGGPLKGIIEHLPSRRKRTFSGDIGATVAEFVSCFLPEKLPLAIPEVSAPDTSALVSKSSKAPAPKPFPERPRGLIQRLQEEFLVQFPELSAG